MPLAQTTYAERTYHASSARLDQTAREAAEQCNELLTATQASTLRLAMDACPEAAAVIAEAAFEVYGWPGDELDVNWLDEAGRETWAAYQIWRAA